MNMPETTSFSWMIFSIAVIAAIATASHAIIHKRDPRSATIWLLAVALVPLGGSLCYLLFGINRVNRKAMRLRAARPAKSELSNLGSAGRDLPPHLASLARLGGTVSGKELLPGNRCTPLFGGTEAYPQMLQAICEAKHSIALASYIFEGKGIGALFVDTLAQARSRGVSVKVLIDDAYARLSNSDAYGALRLHGIDVALFNPPVIPARLHGLHLRNHRKLLIVDGYRGFTGGMNIHRPYWCPKAPESAFRDLHLEVSGPVVGQMRETFERDWYDSKEEELNESFWTGKSGGPITDGCSLARGIESGPDETLDRMRWIFIGAINAAQKKISIRTPYFLPDQPTIAALGAAALRGVRVEIVVPQNSDHPFVQWASKAHYWQIIEHGVCIYERPGPFDHGKLMIIDDAWVCVGSANWDARSLRLNFEFNLEIYDRRLALELGDDFARIRSASKKVRPTDLSDMPYFVKLRNGFARLFSPIL